MTLILTSLGVLLVKGCSRFGRSTRWSGRCAHTCSASSPLIPQRCVPFKLVSNTTLPVQARIQRRSSLSQLPLHLPTKAPLISAQVALLCLLSLPPSPCPRMLQLSPVRR